MAADKASGASNYDRFGFHSLQLCAFDNGLLIVRHMQRNRAG
jgi:hypothetical protein